MDMLKKRRRKVVVVGAGAVGSTCAYALAHCGVDVHNVHAYVLGEHGDTEFAAWSMTHVAGMQIDSYCPICGTCSDQTSERGRIERTVRESAYHIIDYKGATSFAVGLALVRITAAANP
jgi:L-lactate dehydrogenase